MSKISILCDMDNLLDPRRDQSMRSLSKRTRLKRLTDKIILMVEEEVVFILHAHRDRLRNRFIHQYKEWQRGCLESVSIDPRRSSFDLNDGHYGEVLGIFRCLARQNYGYLGSVNLDAIEERATLSTGALADPRQNFCWWLHGLETLVLEQEHFNGNGTCSYCMVRWGKDDSVLSEQAGEPILRKDGEPSDVHTEHCCVACGCKYDDDNCSVVTGKLKQSYACGTMEQCGGFSWEM